MQDVYKRMLGDIVPIVNVSTDLRTAFRMTFGPTLVCADLDNAMQLARQYNVRCPPPSPHMYVDHPDREGDVRDGGGRRGARTGRRRARRLHQPRAQHALEAAGGSQFRVFMMVSSP